MQLTPSERSEEERLETLLEIEAKQGITTSGSELKPDGGEVFGRFFELEALQDALRLRSWQERGWDRRRVVQTTCPLLDAETLQTCLRMLGALEELDDVGSVTSNLEARRGLLDALVACDIREASDQQVRRTASRPSQSGLTPGRRRRGRGRPTLSCDPRPLMAMVFTLAPRRTASMAMLATVSVLPSLEPVAAQLQDVVGGSQPGDVEHRLEREGRVAVFQWPLAKAERLAHSLRGLGIMTSMNLSVRSVD